MSETFAATRKSLNRLRAALESADEDARWAFGFWVSGLVMMTVAIVGQFGWLGALFCLGAVLRSIGDGK